jgi:predicted ribosome quality control (RQC) complex YloA/Tae2 family protein
MSLDGLSLSLLVAELHTILCGGRIEKIFQPDAHSLTLFIRTPGKTVRLILSADPKQPRMHISVDSAENPNVPPAFCMLLRKHLDDGRINSIVQHSLDRTVMIHVDVREEGGTIAVKTLIVELMGKHSNIIFVDKDTIIDSIRRVGPAMSRYRLVLPGRQYTLPPGQGGVNILSIAPETFVNDLRGQTGLIQKVIMNQTIGLGPVSVKEILWRAGVGLETNTTDIDESGWRQLQSAIKSIVGPMRNLVATPHVRVNTANKVTGFAAFPLKHLTDAIYEFTTMSQAVDFISGLAPQAPPEKERLQKFVANELKRLQRKKEALTVEHELANAADELRRKADILMTYLSTLPPGQAIVSLPDIYAEQPDTIIQIELEPRETPSRNAQIYYNRYNKQKRAQQNLAMQLKQLNEEITYLDSVQLMLEHTQTPQETREIEEELIAGGYLAKRGKRKPEQASAPLTIRLNGGSVITVGKNNRQNDIVTFKLSRPDDLWFHTKDIPGSHVILRSVGSPDNDALQTAAMVAAYFSKARQSSRVPVDYTLRRYVKKPSGAKPGFVIYDKQNTLFVTPEAEIITELLNPKKDH